jgi:hypothetical protein
MESESRGAKGLQHLIGFSLKKHFGFEQKNKNSLKYGKVYCGLFSGPQSGEKCEVSGK